MDFHGLHKPAGLNRTYPNVINYEGVAGMENDKWIGEMATPTMAVTLPYTRMFTGPMDYTLGAMRNTQKDDFKAIFDYPISLFPLFGSGLSRLGVSISSLRDGEIFHFHPLLPLLNPSRL